MTNLFQKVGEIIFPGIAEFIVSENFVIDTSGKNKVKISYLGKNFPLWFIDKVENHIPSLTIICTKLLRDANDNEIVDALGGEVKANVSLSEMFNLMLAQTNGENGVLLNDGSVNFFYVKDSSGSLRTIRLLWQDGGWGVHAIRPHDPLNLPVWDVGSQVFFRK